jgi:hypothetical protein
MGNVRLQPVVSKSKRENIMSQIRYLPENGGQGFIDVIQTSEMSNPQGGRKAFPGYLKVNYLGIKVLNGKQRDYFIPYEGKYKDREMSVTRKSDGGSYLVTGNILPAAKVIFNPVKANLWYGEGTSRVGPIFAQGSSPNIPGSTSLRDGVYEISVPDEPHNWGDPYMSESSYARLWYPIPIDQDRDGKNDDRFIHCGENSGGCVTVRDVPQWTGIGKYLYNRRLRDGVIGTITVNSSYTG